MFNHVHTFFARYHEGGDFSKRRCSRRQGYSVPYNGEQVYLYGANADPYYEGGSRGRLTVARG